METQWTGWVGSGGVFLDLFETCEQIPSTPSLPIQPFLSVTYKSWILQRRLRHAVHQVLPVWVAVPPSVHVLTAAAGHQGPDRRVVEIHMEVRGDLPAVLDVKQ